jgi:subtilisin family serine protease
MNYKAFYENDSVFAGMAFETELMAAIEDAVADGADVISNSWGGRESINPRFSPLAVTANAAADAGVPVVFSAGNAGPSKSTADSGDLNNKLIMVGASTAAQTFAAGFVDVVAPAGVPAEAQQLPYGAADFGQLIMHEIFGPAAYVPVDVVANSPLACDPLPPDSLSGKIALIERGICHFSAKVYHAQQAGAIGAVVYNSEEGGDTIITMGGADFAEEVKIPSVFIERSAGMAMIDWYHQHGDAVLVQIDPTPRIIDMTPDVVAPFSSRGPTFQHELKPDVVAPGVNILSAGFANAEGVETHLGFGVSSGTSMAAPHVSGAVALLKQAHPEWSPIDIKSALMTTANAELWLDVDRTQAAGVLDRGAGRIDLGRAVNPGLLINPPSLSFGNITPMSGQPTRAETTVQARNISGATQTYTIQGRQTGSAAFAISVSPPSLTLAPGETGVFHVAIELPPDAPAGDYEGMVELQGPTNLHLPIWTRALPAERGAKVLLLDNDGSSSIELYNYADYYVNLLEELNVDYTYLDIDARAGEQQTLPDVTELLKHEIILWFTGDNNVPDGSFSVPTPLTELDQNVLMAYLQGGGNLIATGQNLAQASDIEPLPDDPQYGRSDLYRSFLASRFIQEDVFGEQEGQLPAVTGIGREAWLEGISLDLTAPAADGLSPSAQTSAGNQDSVDEVKVIDMDPRMPDKYTFPILETSSPGVQMEGYVALHRYSFPTLEEPEPAFTYRVTYLAFGLEGVRSDTSSISRKEFLQRLLFWHVDYPGVDLQGPVVTTEPNQAVQLTANAHSNIPTTFVRYRWDFGDGSPYVETQEPTVEHSYAQPGTYPVRVEVTDSWGHRAVSGVPNLGERKPVPYTPDDASQSLESTGPQQPAVAPQTAAAVGTQSTGQPTESPMTTHAGTMLEGFVENVQSAVEHMRQQVENGGE